MTLKSDQRNELYRAKRAKSVKAALYELGSTRAFCSTLRWCALGPTPRHVAMFGTTPPSYA